MILKNLKLTYITSASLQPAIRPGCTRCMAPDFSHNKSIVMSDLQNCCLMKVCPLRHGDFFYP